MKPLAMLVPRRAITRDRRSAAAQRRSVEQFVETLSPFFESTTRIDFEILRTQAMGKVVINERHDLFCFSEGGAEWFFPVVGVFILEEGKIIHWKDYVTPGKKTRM